MKLLEIILTTKRYKRKRVTWKLRTKLGTNPGQFGSKLTAQAFVVSSPIRKYCITWCHTLRQLHHRSAFDRNIFSQCWWNKHLICYSLKQYIVHVPCLSVHKCTQIYTLAKLYFFPTMKGWWEPLDRILHQSISTVKFSLIPVIDYIDFILTIRRARM